MTRDEIAALIERIPTRTTPGPWRNNDDHISAPDGQDVALVGRFTDDPHADDNAALIALAPDLASAVRTLAAENERLREALSVFADDVSWRLGGPCDPNSATFNGTFIARSALNPKD